MTKTSFLPIRQIVVLLLLVFLIPFSIHAQEAKYVFFFIGDGMGLSHVTAADAYLKASKSANDTSGLCFTKFPVAGFSTTYAGNRFITGSAAAGTALACGQKTSIGTIGMDMTKMQAMPSLAEMAKKQGYKVGIISSVSIDHATPASFYAHQPERNNYYEIACSLPASNFDFFGGGSFKKHKLKDEQISAYDLARQQGYTITNTREDFDKLKKGDKKVFASGSITEGSGALRYAIDQTDADIPLEDFVAKAIELLDNKKGFFIMCEEGKIDWAAHANDGATMVKNVVSLSEAVKKALDFYEKHPDETLIVITADHETGGFALGSATMKYDSDFALLDHQDISAQAFTSIADSLFAIPANLNVGYAMQLVEDYFGMGDDAAIQLSPYEKSQLEEAFFVMAGKISPDNEAAYIDYGGDNPLTVTATEILNNKAGIAWTTWSHTGVPVPVYAIGAGAESFKGFYDNTDIPKKIARLMNIDFNE